jgi:hypothetical protein
MTTTETIEVLDNILSFLDIERGYFYINAANDALVLTSSEGGPSTITLDDGTYDGDSLATEIQTQLNADSVLTGSGTITFAVSYSSTTYKFTIDVTSGHTIAYTHADSTAGFTIGFYSSKQPAQTITSDGAASDPTDIVSTVHSEVEAYVCMYCRRTFVQTEYSLERYNGDGYRTVNLNNYPVIDLDRVVIGVRNVISIKNTSTGTSASVSVKSTGLRLVRDGTADETVLFETYTTISTVVAAVNALGNGWSASIMDTTYSSFKSTDIVTEAGKSCINSTVVYLSIPDEAECDVEIDYDAGQIVLPTPFSKGFKNIFVDYKAGYTQTNMPDDLKLAVKIIIQFVYEKMKNNVYGIEFYNIGASGSTGLRTIFEKGFTMPKEAEFILNKYKRVKV